MSDRKQEIKATRDKIREGVAAAFGEDRAEKNQAEIETLAAMIERVRRLQAPPLDSLNPDRAS